MGTATPPIGKALTKFWRSAEALKPLFAAWEEPNKHRVRARNAEAAADCNIRHDVARPFSLSSSDGERVGVRGCRARPPLLARR